VSFSATTGATPGTTTVSIAATRGGISRSTSLSLTVISAAQPVSPQPTILGLGATLFYVIVGLILVIIIMAVALVFRRSRMQKTASKNSLPQ
jgi:hypothetical protein